MYEGRAHAEREALTLSHKSIAHSVARKFSRRLRRFYEYEDLVAYGLEAIWLASGTWDPDGGASFMTYGHKAVLNTFLNLLDHWNRPNRSPAYSALSLDEPYPSDPDGDPRLQIASSLLDPEALAAREDRHRYLIQKLAELEPRDRRLLKARFEQDITLGDFGKTEGLTRERARQLELRALDRLRDKLIPLFPELADAPGVVSAKAATGHSEKTVKRLTYPVKKLPAF